MFDRDLPVDVDRLRSEWKTPGVAVAVVKENEVLFARGFGSRGLDSNFPVTPETIFPIASATKPFTSMCVGMLVEQGQVNWDTPVRCYIPGFEMFNAAAGHDITARDMATHRSGLPRHELFWYNAHCSREELVHRIRYLQPNKGLRTTWQYTNVLYAALGYLIECVTGETWEQFVKKHIFEPLGMISTSVSTLKSPSTVNHAVPHMDRSGVVCEISDSPSVDRDPAAPCGGVNSNVLDLTEWLLCHINGGSTKRATLISPAALREMQTPHMPCSLDPWDQSSISLQSYGLGWFIEPYRGKTVIHHGGHKVGFSSLVSFMPDAKLGIVVLSNKDHVPIPQIITRQLYDALLGHKDTDWNNFYRTKKEQASLHQSNPVQSRRNQQHIGTHPSHAMDEYTGLYEHPGYGSISVEVESGALTLYYNDMKWSLTRFHYDIFEFSYESLGLVRTVAFHTGIYGGIDSLSIRMELAPEVDPIVFTRLTM